jgi:hypothetical protein
MRMSGAQNLFINCREEGLMALSVKIALRTVIELILELVKAQDDL